MRSCCDGGGRLAVAIGAAAIDDGRAARVPPIEPLGRGGNCGLEPFISAALLSLAASSASSLVGDDTDLCTAAADIFIDTGRAGSAGCWSEPLSAANDTAVDCRRGARLGRVLVRAAVRGGSAGCSCGCEPNTVDDAPRAGSDGAARRVGSSEARAGIGGVGDVVLLAPDDMASADWPAAAICAGNGIGGREPLRGGRTGGVDMYDAAKQVQCNVMRYDVNG
jgi:hypothetical protein